MDAFGNKKLNVNAYRQENLNLKFLYKIPFTTLPQKKKNNKKKFSKSGIWP